MDNLLKLIQTLGKNMGNQIPIRQLSKESQVPYTTTYRSVKNNSNIFNIEKKGNIKLVSLNFEDSITKNYLILAERNSFENFVKKNPQFRVMKKDFSTGNYAVVLFGSRAERKERNKSDVDLCIINKEGTKTLSFSKFEMLYKIEINPIFLKDKEFKQMLKDKEHNLAHEVVKKHVVLYGEEYFWNLIWKNGIQ